MKDMLDDSKLNNIIKEAINDFVDKGEFTPIGSNFSLIDKNEIDRKRESDRISSNSEKILSAINGITHALWTQAKYISHSCAFKTELNPMFVRELPDSQEKKQMEIALQVYKKSMDLYDFLQGLKEKL